MTVQVVGVRLPEVQPGDDLAALIAASGAELHDGDVVVVTSKVVSKAESRLVPGSRDEHLDAETVRVVATRGDLRIVQTRHGFVMAAAGIDASNVPAGMVALLPVDPDASAARVRDGLRTSAGVDVAVIVSDTMGRPWRDGVTDVAIGAAGIKVLDDLRGLTDPAGNRLEATVVAVADELAAAADLVKGKLAATPVAVIRGVDVGVGRDGVGGPGPDAGAQPLVRPSADDMFRLGTQEAMRAVVEASAPVVSTRPAGDPVPVRRAVDAVRDSTAGPGSPAVTLDVAEDGSSVTASGEPFAVGLTVGRLLAALAAEGMRGAVEAPADGAAAVVRVGHAGPDPASQR